MNRTLSRAGLAALFLISAAFFLGMAVRRGSFERVAGDEGTYLAMAESLALDGDLAFGTEDQARVESAPEPGRRAVVLQASGTDVAYSKPAVYPLLMAPAYRLAGRTGAYVLNALVLAGGLALAWLYLRRFGRDRALWLGATFAGAGSLLAYVAWAMSDAVQVGLTLAGLALVLGPVERSGATRAPARILAHPAAPLAGGLLLGLVAGMRVTNAAVAVAAVAACLAARARRPALFAAAGIAAALLLSAAADQALTGSISPYSTVRATFDPASGYPVGPGAEEAAERFDQALATVRLQKVRARVFAYASLYFLGGRHSGLLAYFPLALVLAAGAIGRRDRVGLVLLAGAAALAAIYLVRLPHNFFGGGATIGNRYFLPGCAALLFAPAALPRRRTLVAVWVVAAAFGLSGWMSVGAAGELDRSSQSHAYAGLFRVLPYESTANNLEGTRERFWLHAWTDWEILRFTDPWSEVGQYSFRLATGRPPAEVEIASRRSDRRLHFLVHSAAPELRLVYRDWGRTAVFDLRRPFGERGLVEIEASPAWRRHPFWFHWDLDQIYHARLARLAIETPDGEPAEATVRYLGPLGLPDDLFARTVLEADVPRRAVAGSTGRIRLRVRNDSARTWTSSDIIATYLGYRLRGPGGETIEGRRRPIRRVAVGQVLQAAPEVHWPDTPGRWTLEADLVVEGYTWFAAQTGAPLAAAEVEVVAGSG